ncbi:hypothetical protein TorRG33x02_318860 [Trema orientale]|uniref:Uncharacterized protein n=1 Tax=Trema orientale TaxID=63057 RepID=A0A2P5BJM0_TREOI|nr:hypothetical protein TorRG33x02_318860 [Trema orientale]
MAYLMLNRKYFGGTFARSSREPKYNIKLHTEGSPYSPRDPTTNELPSLIDQFQDMHHRFQTGWTKEVAHAKHVEMVHLKESQSQYQSAASSSSSVSMDSTQPILTERQIMEHILGYRAGHAKGIGPLLKGTSKKQRESSSFTSATSSSRPPQNPMMERWIAQQMAFNQQQANYSRVLFEILRSALPHIDIPPPPTPPPGFDEPTPPPEPRMEDNGD